MRTLAGRLTLAAVLIASQAVAQEGTSAESEPAVDLIRAEVSLRAYAVYPKFRFRDGHRNGKGDSFRTQRIGLGDWELGPGGSAGVWLFGTEWVGLHAWSFGGGGEGVLTRDMRLSMTTLRQGSRVRTDYQLSYLAAEYLHRFDLFDGLLWVDAGVRADYLDFRANVVNTGRVKIEALWPSPRVHFGLRPLEGLELEGRVGGFHLDFPVRSTVVTQAFEVGGMVRVRLPAGVFAEAGGFMYHVHLEEDAGELREDVLHLRHRTLFVTLGLAF